MQNLTMVIIIDGSLLIIKILDQLVVKTSANILAFIHSLFIQILIKFAVDGGCHMWAGNAYSSGAPDSTPLTLSWGSILVFYIWNLSNWRAFKSWPNVCLSVLIVYSHSSWCNFLVGDHYNIFGHLGMNRKLNQDFWVLHGSSLLHEH